MSTVEALSPVSAAERDRAAPSRNGIVVQRRCSCGRHTNGSGVCEECRRARRVGPSGPVRRLEAPVAARLGIAGSRLAGIVRIHDGSAAGNVAASAGAEAMTSGADIFFARGAYRPGSRPGLELLAHELVHVVQQHGPGGPPAGYVSRPGDAWEREADIRARALAVPKLAPDAGRRGAALQRRTAAQQIATILRQAAEGWGTDEDAIFMALTGRTPQEIADIAAAYAVLSGGETLIEMLNDELSDDELARALSLVRGETPASESTPTRLASALRDAVQGPGTRERAINAILARRTATERAQIGAEYARLYGESLRDRLEDELTGTELLEGAILEREGELAPEDEIKISVEGLGTDEERLFAVLTEISVSPARVEQTIDAYSTKGYGNMLEDIADDLSGDELTRAMELLHRTVPTTACTPRERDLILRELDAAVALSQQAIAGLDRDIAAGRLSSGLADLLQKYFNGARVSGAVTVGLARQVRATLATARTELLRVARFGCGPGGLCVANQECESHYPAWTDLVAGAVVHVCEVFFRCDPEGHRGVAFLHEFLHHSGLHDHVRYFDPAFLTLPTATALNNPDSFAQFAKEIRDE